VVHWKTKSLGRLFEPKAIAVIGASATPNRLGALALRALSTYEGEVYPVNPKRDKIAGLKCYPSVKNIPCNVDLVLIALRAPVVLSAIEECADANVGSAIIFSAGFKELGSLGEQLQNRIKEVVDEARIAVIGPNCLGAGNANLNLNATFFPHPIPIDGGKVSLVSQSGGVAGVMLYSSADSGLGISKFASVGNRVNVDFPEIIRYLGQDSETEVICLFVEGTEYARSMYNEMTRVSVKKPIIVYKVGKTPVARSAALSHTGSLAGQPDLYSAAVKQAGGIEVDSVLEMIDTAKILATCRWRPQGNNVAIVTHTLGPSLIAAQILEQRGAQLLPPSPSTEKAVQRILDMPVEIPISNPVDLLAQGWAQPEMFASAFKHVMEESQYHAVMTVFSPNYQKDIGGGMPLADVIEVTNQVQKPVIAILNAPECKPPPGRDELENSGIPVFASPERAAHALANVLCLTR
jgi:acyl-CoA synthetase (NDP forming)